jgi:Mg-chelatase subunit ChlD
MKTTPKILAMLFACSQALLAKETTPEIKPSKPRIEVCFVLDTTGSMSGLIEGAKQKIWSIANEMISAKPTPELKIGLIGYRDRGDEYVVKSFKLTDDIDSIYAHLRAFEAGGGGDTPESVNEALAEAIDKMPWSQDRKVLKIVFLVGDAPPHMDYADGPKYPDLCRAAAKKDLIINTVQCGGMAETTPIWKEIAKMSEGSYVAIAQSGNMAVVSTPMDDDLAKLNKRMGATLIPYGDAEVRREVGAKQAFAESAPAAAAADRLSYNAHTKKSVQGAGELLDALAHNELSLDSIDKKNLPAEFQKLSREEIEARIAKTQEERAVVQKEIDEVSKKRDAYIQAENKRLAAEGKGDSFDEKIAETIRKQAEEKGITYE